MAEVQPAHKHCLHDCEKPQPFRDHNGEEYCGRCRHEGRGYVKVFLCTPVTCPGDA